MLVLLLTSRNNYIQSNIPIKRMPKKIPKRTQGKGKEALHRLPCKYCPHYVLNTPIVDDEGHIVHEVT